MTFFKWQISWNQSPEDKPKRIFQGAWKCLFLSPHLHPHPMVITVDRNLPKHMKMQTGAFVITIPCLLIDFCSQVWWPEYSHTGEATDSVLLIDFCSQVWWPEYSRTGEATDSVLIAVSGTRVCSSSSGFCGHSGVCLCSDRSRTVSAPRKQHSTRKHPVCTPHLSRLWAEGVRSTSCNQMLPLANWAAEQVLQIKWSSETAETRKTTEIPQKTIAGPELPHFLVPHLYRLGPDSSWVSSDNSHLTWSEFNGFSLK